MKWYKDLKIKAKLVIGFMLVGFIAACVGLIGYRGMQSMNAAERTVATQSLPSLVRLHEISLAPGYVRAYQIGLAHPSYNDLNARKILYDKIVARFREADAAWKEFEKIPISADEAKAWNAFKTDWTAWKSGFDQTLRLTHEKDRLLAAGVRTDDPTILAVDKSVWESITSAVGQIDRVEAGLAKITEMSRESASTSSSAAQVAYSSSTRILWSFVAGLCTLSVVIGFCIANIISRPLTKIMTAADALAAGDMNVSVDFDFKDEVGDLGRAFQGVVKSVKGLVTEATLLTSSAVEGKLSTRGDVAKFSGGYREILEGVNRTLDALIAPMTVTVQYIDRISKGDIPPKITDNYNGDFNILKSNLNVCIDAVNALVTDADALAAAAEEGRLGTRADATKHRGNFRKIVEGFNGTLDLVIKPVNEAAKVLSYLAQNDLTHRVTGDYHGDLAKIKDSLNTALDSLNQTLVQVIEAAQQVGTAAGQISSSAQGVAQGTSEQASSLEEISSSLEEISGMTRNNSESAGQARLLATVATTSAETGKDAVIRMNTAIAEIKGASDATARIVKTIDDIAFQTNLLALNAAVEAARAGEAGRGFAVVAEEVRNLALRSAESAKDTARMIEESVHKADNGVKIAAEVNRTLLEISEGTHKVSDLVSEIAAASEEQSKGIEQVTTATAQMDKVTQSNASAAEESASAAEELAAQAAQLSETVSRFKVARGLPRDTHREIADLFSGAEIANLRQLAKAVGAREVTPSLGPKEKRLARLIPLDDAEILKSF